MQSHVNSVAFLRRAAIKPQKWLLIRIDERGWQVGFRWVESDPWVELRTSRGRVKEYRTSDSALADIRSVDAKAVLDVDLG